MEIGSKIDKMTMGMWWYEAIFDKTFARHITAWAHRMISHWVWQDAVLILPIFSGLLTGWLVSGGTLVERTSLGLVLSQLGWFFKMGITQRVISMISYCSITDAAQVQCGRATVAAKWTAHYLAKYLPGTWPGTCQVLVRTWQALARYWQLLVMYLAGTWPGTWPVLDRHLSGTF